MPPYLSHNANHLLLLDNLLLNHHVDSPIFLGYPNELALTGWIPCHCQRFDRYHRGLINYSIAPFSLSHSLLKLHRGSSIASLVTRHMETTCHRSRLLPLDLIFLFPSDKLELCFLVFKQICHFSRLAKERWETVFANEVNSFEIVVRVSQLIYSLIFSDLVTFVYKWIEWSGARKRTKIAVPSCHGRR